MLLIDLNGQWRMKRTDASEWMDAKVPGSMYNDLLQAGLIEDPFFRDNEYKALELSKFDYEYKRDFFVDESIMTQDRVVLICEGLDTICYIYINGNQVAFTNNMHRTYEIDIKAQLVPGNNTILIIFKSPVEYVTMKQKEYPLINVNEAVEGISHLRKAHCMFGWDWGLKLPDMGIWRNISIQCFNKARIDDLYITQIHEKSKVKLDIRLGLDKWVEQGVDIQVKITDPVDGIIEKFIETSSALEHIDIEIENPMLWWPNNYGKQPLYDISVLLKHGEDVLDMKTMRVGLRTLTVKREKDQWGESFAFEVNGVSIFAMGADYIPEDSILARCDSNRTEKLIKSCVDANFNSIRVWGGAFFPEDYFYDLCDEYGLIVWQDLMFACGVYDLNEDFKENIRQETIDNMKRLRHHASLGLWCGNNEQEWGWVEWGWSDKCSPKLKTDYIKQFEVLLPEVAREVDPNTLYWLASPSSGGSFNKPNDESYGDMHYWGVWHGKEPFTSYRNIYPRFMSEFGLQSFPCLKTIETFTLPEDRNIFSYVMESHQKGGTGGNDKILYYIGENFKYPKDFDSLLYASQLIQAEGLRYGVEHWRRNRGRCMGAIYWQLNDCWPVASWASMDYFGRWKALHYAAKRFFAPMLISACEAGTKVSLHVTNEKLEAANGRVEWQLMDNKSNAIAEGSAELYIDALSSKECIELDFADLLDTPAKMRNAYLEFRFIQENQIISSGTVLFVRAKHFDFVEPNLKINCSENSDNFVIEVVSEAFAKFVELDLVECDAIFSDNYFDLSSGYLKTIDVDKKSLSRQLALDEFKSLLKIRSYSDSY